MEGKAKQLLNRMDSFSCGILVKLFMDTTIRVMFSPSVCPFGPFLHRITRNGFPVYPELLPNLRALLIPVLYQGIMSPGR
mgnify:CR=1 FL=1